MTRKSLDKWFNRIDLNGLMQMFQCPPGQSANDFIDDCDEYWEGLSIEKKQELYNRFSYLA